MVLGKAKKPLMNEKGQGKLYDYRSDIIRFPNSLFCSKRRYGYGGSADER
jgi:hypothetical protein